MEDNRRDAQEFKEMPEQVYQELVERSKRVSADTALDVDEHRKLVEKQRAERKGSGRSVPMAS